ncbi:MAG: 4-hydroxy-tetrahydrodipicolinate reductase [Myxococcota bacterium]
MSTAGITPGDPGLVIIGAHGRMGRRLVALAPEVGLSVAAEVDAHGPALDAALAKVARCVIDFSAPAQAQATIAFCIAHEVPLVLGTTGLAADDEAALASAARHIPLVFAANFSLGVHVLMTLVSEAARLLDSGWDVELVEAHHRRKVDAPSGTALALAQRIAAARHVGLGEVVVHGREGQVGARPKGELGMHAVRGGSVVGEHQVRFLGDGEEVVLEHRALDRDIFVRGALRSASWLLGGDRPPGRYGLADVLGRD